MLIETMPTVLRWENHQSILDEIHTAYINQLSAALGNTLGQITLQDRASGQLLTTLLHLLPNQSFLRLLTAPEISYRLLWKSRHRLEATAKFLHNSLIAELARIGQAVTASSCVWTALGDYQFDSDGSLLFTAPQIAGMMPLDFDSPHATHLDLNGQQEVTNFTRPAFSVAQKQLVLERLQVAQQGIYDTDPYIFQFVVDFTKVLILQTDPDMPESFSSGSSGQYVGRSVLANPHLAAIDVVEIAEGLVHEAIHSLLYMQEQQKSWVESNDLYGPTYRTTSPWTGNPLALRPYLQACFVWYGLLHFWSLALAKGTFNLERIKARITQATIGFLGNPLLEQVAAYEDEISPELLAAISAMQAHVTASLAQVA